MFISYFFAYHFGQYSAAFDVTYTSWLFLIATVFIHVPCQVSRFVARNVIMKNTDISRSMRRTLTRSLARTSFSASSSARSCEMILPASPPGLTIASARLVSAQLSKLFCPESWSTGRGFKAFSSSFGWVIRVKLELT